MTAPIFKFSPSTGTFYPSDIAYPSLPDDLILVKPGEFEKAMDRLPSQTFRVTESGDVEVFEAPKPDQTEMDFAIFKSAVTSGLALAREKALSYFMVGEPFPQEWVDYVKALNSLKDATETQPLPTAPSV